MWSFLPHRMASGDSKFGHLKRGYHTCHPLIGPLPDKQFSYMKGTQAPSNMVINYNQSKPEESSQSSNGETCNGRKKKKRRRRRRRKSKVNTEQRQRSLSVQSEDSFVIIFDSGDLSPGEIVGDLNSSDSAIAHKKVRFANDDMLCQVHPMIAWSFAYQRARKGPWEECARDRARFTNKVKNLEALMSHVLSVEHRSKIYKERFADVQEMTPSH